MGKKATRAEVEQRVQVILRMLANGVQRPAILEHARNAWGLSRGSADDYIRKAKDQIIECCEEERKDFIARKLYQLEDVVMKAAKRENHSAMIGAIKTQCELVGLLGR